MFLKCGKAQEMFKLAQSLPVGLGIHSVGLKYCCPANDA
jgi:hypothetical protein